MPRTRQYVYEIGNAAPSVPILILNNPAPAASDQFGSAVAISGPRVVVGAAADGTATIRSGRAYVYDLVGATPAVPVVLLDNASPVGGDSFGGSVAISGLRVVVGASGRDSGAENAGSAYVFDLGNGTPSVPIATLNNPTPTVQDNFGSSVALSGTRVVVGAHRDGTFAMDAGNAYLYDLSSGTPSVAVNTLNRPGTPEGDEFGFSVGISGTRMVVGARYSDLGASNAGSAYVYDLSSSTPTEPVATLNNPTPEANDYFGSSVAISGMLVVVGALGDDSGASDAGSAYVYDLSSGTPAVPVATLNKPSLVVGDEFGGAVAIDGTRVVVGVIGDDTGATSAGSVYVYDLTSGTPTVPVTTLHNPGPAGSDYFGNSVAISDALVVVGTVRDDTGAINAGSAYCLVLGIDYTWCAKE